MAMKRMTFYLADLQIRRLRVLQKKTGLPFSDMLRRAIDAYWDKPGRNQRIDETKRRGGE